MRRIPEIDMSAFGRSEADNERIADQIGAAAREYGFMCLTGHGADLGIIQRAFKAMNPVFQGMTLEQLRRYSHPEAGMQFGYIPPDAEQSVGRDKPNYMQFWHVNDPAGVVPNDFPTEVPEFGPAMLAALAELKKVGMSSLRALAIHLRRDSEFFVRWAENGENLLRPIDYPELTGGESVERSGEHTDINLITLLVSTSAGLQVLYTDGTWIDAEFPPGAILVNIGDMLDMHTFGEFRSVRHRVVNPNGAGNPCPARQSLPLFVHPRVDIALVNAGAYKWRRLREIKLMDSLPPNQIDH